MSGQVNGDLLALERTLSQIGWEVEQLLKKEQNLRLADNSTANMLELLSFDLIHAFELVRDEIKALSRHEMLR